MADRDAGRVLLDVVPDDASTASSASGWGRQRPHLRPSPGRSVPGIAPSSIVTDRPQAPGAYKDRLGGMAGLSHVTVEVESCPPKEGRSAA
jgi:hypothetical protein